MFAIIAPTFTYPDGLTLGKLITVHKTPAQAHVRARRRQAIHAKANPGTHLDLDVIEVEWSDGERARGKRA